VQKAEFWITHLQLQQHPEGGFFRETYRNTGSYDFTGSPLFGAPRSYATAIHYLLMEGQQSRIHRIQSDELWFFHTGSPLVVHIFCEQNVNYSSFTLGPEPVSGHILQASVPAGSWFGACFPESIATDRYALVSCVVAPGFDFRDFEFAPRKTLLDTFPLHKSLIERLT
jgi:uncharacterized protein